MRAPPASRFSPGRVNLLLLLFIAAALIVAGWWVYDRFLKSDVTRIRQLVEGAADKAKERNPAGVTAILSEDFRGPENSDKDLVHKFAIQVLMYEFTRIDVTLSPIPLPVEIDAKDPERATLAFSARVMGKIGDEAEWEDILRKYPVEQAHAFKAYFKKTDKGWRMNMLEIMPETK
jgi:hypothetical protein